jgi:Leucine-rich repeat (LRR) protein
MSMIILNKTYYFNTTKIFLTNNTLSLLSSEIGNLINLKELSVCLNKLTSLPNTIGNLINLKKLMLYNNQLSSLPSTIGNLINLVEFNLRNNKLTFLPNETLKIKDALIIDETSYDINNLDFENEILIFSKLKKEITNLPINIKEIWLDKKY